MRRVEELVLGNKNAAVFWYKVRNPVRILFNGFLMLLSKYFPSMTVKRMLSRAMGMKIGKDVAIAPSILDPIFPELIEIGDNSTVGWDVMILTHEFFSNKLRKGKVKIGKNTTIGARTLVLPGVSIGNDVIVSANSLVNKDVADGKTVGGVPIRNIRLRQR